MLFHNYYHQGKPVKCGDNGDGLERFFSTPEQDLRLLRACLQKRIKQSVRDEKLYLIQMLFPMFHKAAPDRFHITGLIRDLIGQDPQLGAVIAEEAARFPVRIFLRADSFKAYDTGNMGETELAVFRKYCGLIQPEDMEEVLLLLKFRYRFIVCQDITICRLDLLKDFPLLDAFVLPYINDDLFWKGLFAIPRNDPEEPGSYDYRICHEFLAHYLALGQNTDLSETKLTLLRSILYSTEMVYENESDQYLRELFVSATPDINEAESLYERAYNETQDWRFCLRLKKLCHQKAYGETGDSFFLSLPLDLLLCAVEEGELTAEKLGSIVDGQLAGDCADRQGIFRKLGDKIPQLSPEEQSDFLRSFYRQVEKEAEDTAKFGTFLELYSWLPEVVVNFVSSSPGREERIVERCGRLLGKFRGDPDNPELFGMAVSALWLLSSFRPYWKGLNPFLIAFRNSRAVFLEGNLAPKANTLAWEILHFFHRDNNKEKLRQLRQDMADSFADRLKPAKQPRDPEAYTVFEQKQEGFDLSLVEPDPFWRYAYIRALSDLGVSADGKGHSFKKNLLAVAKKDPSPWVREAAEKAMKKLDLLREGLDGENHRKRLCQAFWWLRQASLLGLGRKIDKKGARDLRIKESRRGFRYSDYHVYWS
jgi:hypothetical protein